MAASPTTGSEGSTLHDGAGNVAPSHAKPQEQQQQQNESEFLSLWDPSLKSQRKEFLKQWAIFKLDSLKVALVDLDSRGANANNVNAVLGPVLLQAPQNLPNPNNLGFVQVDNSRFAVSGGQSGLDVHEWARYAVHNADYFGVIIANANATSAAINAYQTVINGGTVQYDATGALSMYYEEGRNFETVDQWVAPRMNSFVNNQVLPTAATDFMSLIANRISSVSAATFSNIDATALANVVSTPFAPAIFNVRPIQHFAGIPATSVGLIYVLIFTYFISMQWNSARAGLESKLRLIDLAVLRVVVPVAIYVFISLWISLVTLAFRVDFTQSYGKGGFPLFWLSNFMTMWALGMPMEVALSFLGPKYTAFFLLWWVVWNVSDIADMAIFYRYGFGFPVYQAVENGKAIIFGTKSRFGLRFGVLTAWIVCGTAALVLTTMYKRHSAKKQKQQQQEEKEREERQREKRESRPENGEKRPIWLQ
ncbi:hypothetical protein JCM8202v2_002531 [Rhodotorula sphaerocarpa]